ncbi:DedD protein [Gammaproteobacteria bacterium]
MSPENKQRIVGVVVLVAFIALLVPFLFTSGIKKKLLSADEIPINAKKRQLITKQIQSINGAAAIPPVIAKQPAADTATAVAIPPVTAKQPADTAATAAAISPVTAEQPANIAQLPALPQDQQFDQPDMLLPPENNQTELLNQSVSTVASTEIAPINISNVATQAGSTISVVPVKSTPKNRAIKKSKAVPKTKNKNTQLINATVSANTKEFWSVQVGSFSDEVRAQKLLTQLHSKGFHVYTQKITTSTGSLTRVLVGREASKEKASQIAGQLETTMKIKGRLIRSQK